MVKREQLNFSMRSKWRNHHDRNYFLRNTHWMNLNFESRAGLNVTRIFMYESVELCIKTNYNTIRMSFNLVRWFDLFSCLCAACVWPLKSSTPNTEIQPTKQLKPMSSFDIKMILFWPETRNEWAGNSKGNWNRELNQ